MIDNIFTNDIENNTVSGLLISDISDHLPVFTVYDNNYKRNQLDVKQDYRRVRTEKYMNAFKSDLLPQDWGVVYKENNIDNAYNIFKKIFISLYEKTVQLYNIIENKNI